MLEQLRINNIALFEEATLDFGTGFHVLTGETGAGKSLVVDAVSFLCGGKADKNMIRTGSSKASVEGLFDVANVHGIVDILSEMDIQTEDGKLCIYREINQAGRSVCRIEGVPVSLAMQKSICSLLVDIHGQHEHQSLLKDSMQLHYLDMMGDEKHATLLTEVAEMFDCMRIAEREYQNTLKDQEYRQDRMAVLNAQKDELDNAKLVVGEDEHLLQTRNILRNADKISKALQSSISYLVDGQTNDCTALSLQQLAVKQLSSISELSHEYMQIYDRAESICYEIEELGHDFYRLLSQVDTDYVRMEETEKRLDLIRKLNRKYGASIEGMLQTLEQINDELVRLDKIEILLDNLYQVMKSCQKNYYEKANELHQKRKKLGKTVANKIERLLSELNMSGTQFAFHVSDDISHPSPMGIDKVSMIITPNVGEESKPLSKIASGGELSRIMLALKTLTAQKNEVPTMVFDEIDTGVSGNTALVIAQKIWDIAKYRQVICVTHLHQIASMANVQFLVSKTESEGRTKAKVDILDANQRTMEIAKMLGDISTQEETSIKHARILLRDAEQYRKNRKD